MNRHERFARVVATAVLHQPAAWRLLRRPFARFFDRLAPEWDTFRRPDSFDPFLAALELVEPQPRRALDLGTGTGAAALLVAARFPATEVVGVDIAPRMVEAAQRKAGRVRFLVADAARLPFEDGAFDLVTLANMIPFFDELARIVAPGASVLVAFSSGAQTPIYVAPGRLRAELGRRGFTEFQEVAASRGIAVLAKRAPVA